MGSLTEGIIVAIIASVMSGLGMGIINSYRGRKREIARTIEKAHDQLLLELKDLQIKLYKLEKDLNEWKDKYYEAIQDLIVVKAELERTLTELAHIEAHDEG